MFERRTPHIFAHGTSLGTKLVLLGMLSLLLMVADGRLQIASPVRQAVGTAVYPLQWLMAQPVRAWGDARQYMQDLHVAQQHIDEAQKETLRLAERINHVEHLEQENERLRGLLGLRARIPTRSVTAQISYEAPDPFTNRLVIDKGMNAGVRPGAPVLDSAGVLGQVTQVFPLTSEVRVVTDREQTVPVMNLRTGLRMVASGEARQRPGKGLELRFVPAGSDVQEGDVLVTSGIDGYYPPGVPVGQVHFVEAHNDAPFIRIFAQPLAQIQSARYVMVLEPVGLPGENGPELHEPHGPPEPVAASKAPKRAQASRKVQ
ncbi:rod shape-determining protein MreC [Allofranklinella schreckenbergeri]|uniref:Cell shape-determining protein MreC n=1 Tax=Allofranklinella schreckenbergeri TaxID=1076744 RepID=A0A3M6QEA7_9BURK|nr:rod shape-determining protein MreC [Allofranklinella schreckenbergeri]RMX00991.1 rod shape-determining protein MreC [Allofranklinella schreckenbergeri]